MPAQVQNAKAVTIHGVCVCVGGGGGGRMARLIWQASFPLLESNIMVVKTAEYCSTAIHFLYAALHLEYCERKRQTTTTTN